MIIVFLVTVFLITTGDEERILEGGGERIVDCLLASVRISLSQSVANAVAGAIRLIIVLAQKMVNITVHVAGGTDVAIEHFRYNFRRERNEKSLRGKRSRYTNANYCISIRASLHSQRRQTWLPSK